MLKCALCGKEQEELNSYWEYMYGPGKALCDECLKREEEGENK